MVYRKRNIRKRVAKKRAYKKRKYQMTTVNRGLQPFASRFITKGKYSEAFTLNIGNAWTQVMNLNSIFDPNQSSIGHQMYGRDQLAAIYNRYRVISTKYVINAYSGSSPIRFGCLPCNEFPPVSTMSELCENPRAQFRIQLPNGSTSTIRGRVSLPQLMGRTKAQYMADDRFQAAQNASPAELAYLYITGQSLADANVDISLVVTMEFTVEFFDPHPIDQS